MSVGFKTIAPLLCLSFLVSCASINSSQERELREWTAKDLKQEEKSPGLAAGLNIFPGFGDFYNGNYGYGTVNLLLWPASVLWAPVGGANGAKEVNYFATKAYVEELENKKKKVKIEIESAMFAGQITKEEFYMANKKLEARELIDFSKNLNASEFLPVKEFNSERQPSNAKK